MWVENLKNKSDASEGLENSLSKNSQNSMRNNASKSSSPLHKFLKNGVVEKKNMTIVGLVRRILKNKNEPL